MDLSDDGLASRAILALGSIDLDAHANDLHSFFDSETSRRIRRDRRFSAPDSNSASFSSASPVSTPPSTRPRRASSNRPNRSLPRGRGAKRIRRRRRAEENYKRDPFADRSDLVVTYADLERMCEALEPGTKCTPPEHQVPAEEEDGRSRLRQLVLSKGIVVYYYHTGEDGSGPPVVWNPTAGTMSTGRWKAFEMSSWPSSRRIWGDDADGKDDEMSPSAAAAAVSSRPLLRVLKDDYNLYLKTNDINRAKGWRKSDTLRTSPPPLPQEGKMGPDIPLIRLTTPEGEAFFPEAKRRRRRRPSQSVANRDDDGEH